MSNKISVSAINIIPDEKLIHDMPLYLYAHSMGGVIGALYKTLLLPKLSTSLEASMKYTIVLLPYWKTIIKNF